MQGSIRQDAALEVGAKLALYVAWKTVPVVVAGLPQKGLQVTRDDAVQEGDAARVFLTTTDVGDETCSDESCG